MRHLAVFLAPPVQEPARTLRQPACQPRVPDPRKLAREGSAIHHASKGDPPTLPACAGAPDNIPLPENASRGLLIHHPYLGKVLKQKLDKLGVENQLHCGRNRPGPEEIAAFLAKHLKYPPSPDTKPDRHSPRPAGP